MRRDIVIVGAGIVGSALAYHLARLGVTNITVIERGALFGTSGSTGHAPGVVFRVHSSSRLMTEMAKYSVELYRSLIDDLGSCFLPVGGLEVATSPERLGFLYRKADLASSSGLEATVLTPIECTELFPLIDPRPLYGGLFVPGDGLAKAVRAATVMGRAAEQAGVEFRDRTSIREVLIDRGTVSGVRLSDGTTIETRLLVCCNGIWAQELGDVLGLRLPLVPLQHPFVWTTPLSLLSSETSEARLPVVRHQDRSLYFRQVGKQLGIGSYRHEPVRADTRSLPTDAIVDFDPALFRHSWVDAVTLIPALTEAQIERGINGAFVFTPDGMPLIGPLEKPRGFWIVNGLWITHAAGGAKAAAEWIVEGVPSWDLRECDPRRFEQYGLSRSFIDVRSFQAYREVYDIVHPLQPPAAPRQLRTSPFYLRQQDAGAVFLEAAGWERPQWFESNRFLLKELEIPRRHSWAAQFWSPIVGAEHLQAREAGCIYDLSPLVRVEVVGRDATALLQRLSARDVDVPVGRMIYALFLTPRGTVLSDVTIARVSADRYLIGGNAVRDVQWIRDHGRDMQVLVHDMSGQFCCLGLWGPRISELLHGIGAEIPPLPYFGVGSGFIADVPVLLLRLSFIGEYGYEVLTTPDYGLRLWDLLSSAGRALGIVPIGRGAFEGLRLEKGFRLYGRDVWAEHDPFSAGLEHGVELDKPDFVGRDAVCRIRESPPTRRLVCLEIEDPETVLIGGEPVFSESGTRVGFSTSGAFGNSVGKSLAFAWLAASEADPGTRVRVRQFRHEVSARVLGEPAFDPTHDRMRAPRQVRR
ncbi:MAG: FAD-dependent oxidoreductase [Thermomicrobium sp.]|nr:FAD-dependent oxidoreductase [Thermomicrobium sp.]